MTTRSLVASIMDHLSLITIEKGRVYHYCISSNSKSIIIGIDEVMMISNSIKKQIRIENDKIFPSEWLSSVMLIERKKAFCKQLSSPVLIQPTKTVSHEPMNDITMTKDITEIFTYSENNEPHFILIEGVPGIGKTVLAKEICYQWANEQILQKFKLVFPLLLQDPALKKMSKITHLLQLLCQRGTKFPNVTSACVDHLFKNNGKDILFLLDGLDEISNNLQNNNNIIADILRQKVLPQCTVVVTSRPCAVEILDLKVTTKIKLLGFTKDEVEPYVQMAMEGEPHKINNLMKYLTRQPVINYFLPFNITILVSLYKHELSLPTSSAELYNTFICFTVCRHLAKCGIHSVTNLTDLPEPYYERFQQLTKLSYQTLNKNWSFTLDEIKIACPNIKGIDDEYGLQHFGLLQEVKHISHNTTYNFIHYSIQEFLAAWHLSTLQSIELELRFLKEYFWRDDYFKIFSMYVTLTKGQRPSFKKFLSRNEMIPISCNWLNDQLKCLRLFHCFYEAGDTKLCRHLEMSQTFKDQAIELPSINLSAIDIECITVFLTSSSQKEWHELNLNNCGIKDHGIYILLRHGLLTSHSVSITMLQLSYNGLTKVSSSLVSNIVVNCNVKKLKMDGNPSIGENQLCTMLNNQSKLECLHLIDTELSSSGLDGICMVLKNNKMLKELVVNDNNITDDACSAITALLQKNSCLVKLWMWKNPIHRDTLTLILKALQANNTLAFLGLPSCSEVTKMTLESLQEVVNEKRKNRQCKVKLVIDFM